MTMAEEEIPCPFCGRYRRQVVIEENGYLGVKCPRCQLIYLCPRPSWQKLLNHYAAAPSRVDFHPRNAAKRHKAWYTLSLLRPYLRGGSVLEIGPGDGAFLLALAQLGFSVYAIELNRAAAEFLHNSWNIPCETRPLSVSSFGYRKFDLIYHCDVLSHLYDPLADFAIMHAKLKDQGLLVFETGNLGEVHPRYYHVYPSFRYPEHLWFFGERSLRLLLTATGFEVVRLYRYNLLPPLFLERGYRLWKALRSPVATPNPEAAGTEDRHFRKSRSKGFLARIYYELAEYFLPYRLGATFPGPRAGRPQTLIVVARKARGGG